MDERAKPGPQAAVRRNAWKAPLAAGVGCAFALAVVWLLSYKAARFHDLDVHVLSGFTTLGQKPRATRLADLLAHSADPTPFLEAAAVLVAVALLRRRPRYAAAVVTILLGANFCTERLKPLLPARHAAQFAHNGLSNGGSYPSGHATAAMSLALCAVLVSPARLRPAVATLGCLYAIGVSYAFLALAWHYPSDVLGGFLMAALWTMLVGAALRAADERWPTGSARRRALAAGDIVVPILLLVALAAAGVGAAIALKPHAVGDYARNHPSLLLGIAAIGVLGVGVAFGVTRLLTPRPGKRQAPS